ncbi:hypothetical protein I7I50_12645 [Histoplasma capsulatum G186AR]|uniref:Uncharacterized protein n=1 Tax=Ajellomyces capsulatus TaxID=5037 RepID=A0A8H7Y7M1_AJECA|nr:hypothetical protein I7I52_11050 [Histoplasma capsulatum]QSS70870.1 hypothetical protein I7I50_12645 [Histoplasma capsulatum G186AR]
MGSPAGLLAAAVQDPLLTWYNVFNRMFLWNYGDVREAVESEFRWSLARPDGCYGTNRLLAYLVSPSLTSLPVNTEIISEPPRLVRY